MTFLKSKIAVSKGLPALQLSQTRHTIILGMRKVLGIMDPLADTRGGCEQIWARMMMSPIIIQLDLALWLLSGKWLLCLKSHRVSELTAHIPGSYRTCNIPFKADANHAGMSNTQLYMHDQHS